MLLRWKYQDGYIKLQQWTLSFNKDKSVDAVDGSWTDLEVFEEDKNGNEYKTDMIAIIPIFKDENTTSST